MMKLSSRSLGFGAISLAVPLLLTSPAFAQALDNPLVLPAEIEVRGRGWGQITNTAEVMEFALCLVEATFLTALLAFHPVNLHYRKKVDLGELQKGLFLFALIGMLTGFLVVHHGYLIGFVVFGIGSLFRFRMESSSIGDTGQMVIGALLGLAVGLDLPVMALVGAVAAWLILYVFGKTQSLSLEVKFAEDSDIANGIARVRASLEASGFSTASITKAKFKPMVSFVVAGRQAHAQSLLAQEMSRLQADAEGNVIDWHID